MGWKDKLLGRLNSSKKKNIPEPEPKPEVTKEYKSDVALFIDFILKEDKENNIVLGKRKERYYICFKNKYFAPFFSDWFVLMKGFVQGELSQSTYDDSFEALCSKYAKAAKKETEIEKSYKENQENQPENEVDNKSTTDGTESKSEPTVDESSEKENGEVLS